MPVLHKLTCLATGLAVGLAVSASALTAGTANAAAVTFNSTRDCDANAVMYCGAMSTDELQQKYGETANIAVIYNHFGISAADVAAMDDRAVAGAVTKSGTVTVGGKVVAKDALTVGRQDIAGSTKVTKDGVTFYTRSPQVSFRSDSIDAFVVLNKDGQFEYAVLAACGNAVKATNTVPKPTAPTPPPTPPTPPTPPVAPPTPPVTPPTPPTPPAPTPPAAPVTESKTTPVAETLPETGMAETTAVVVAAIIAGTIGYRQYLKRRLA